MQCDFCGMRLRRGALKEYKVGGIGELVKGLKLRKPPAIRAVERVDAYIAACRAESQTHR